MVTKVMQMTPQRTWNPWNPVVVKNTEPNRLFDGVKCSMNSRWWYSKTWTERKLAPIRQVATRNRFVLAMSPRWIAASASTIVTDEQMRRNVLKPVRGTFRTVEGTGHIGEPKRSTM